MCIAKELKIANHNAIIINNFYLLLIIAIFNNIDISVYLLFKLVLESVILTVIFKNILVLLLKIR